MQAEARAKRLVRTVIETLEPRFAVEFWDGEIINPQAETGPRLKIADPTVMRSLALRPSLFTLVEAWCAGRIDIVGGTIFELVERKPDAQLKSRLKALPKGRLIADAAPLLLSRHVATADNGALADDNPFVSGSSKDAISHHYDVSNDFYRLFLDERMVYSCGYFTDWSNDIDQAQHDKLDHICRKLRLKEGDRLLDIGCGWGAMLIHAVKNYGVTGTGVSLSEAQTELARERIRAEGLEDRITIHLKSYTELDGTFDKISSIGMFEHVGSANYETYFSAINRLLEPGGLYLHHAITRRMKRTKKAFRRKTPENRVIIKYIFPGGELDHIGLTLQNLEAHGFEVHDVENLREHYGLTCRIWADRLYARMDEAIAEVGAPKARLWLMYLTGVALAFERGSMQINQTLASKRRRGPSGLPPTRADLYR